MSAQFNLEELFIYKKIQNQSIKEQIKGLLECVSPIISAINGMFPNYTLHDMGHCFRVAKYMEEIALGITDASKESNSANFSDFEFALMIYAAVLHDIGMYYTEDDVKEIKEDKKLYLGYISYNGLLEAYGDENVAVQEIIRRTHHQRVKKFFSEGLGRESLRNRFVLNDRYNFSDVIIQICQAHGEDFSFVQAMDEYNMCGDYKYNPRYIAVLLRIADFIDLDMQRTPILWYRLNELNEFSESEWQKHFIITNNKKFEEVNQKLRIVFYGKSFNPDIHRKFLKFIEDLRGELFKAEELLEKGKSEYALKLSTKIENNVDTVGFDYVDLRLNLDYKSITNLLMGANIYGNAKLGLRELIQNAIDACSLRLEKDKSTIYSSYSPQISIVISKKNNYVKVLDNGMGMDLHIIKDYFLNVGISYYTSDEFIYEGNKYKPIGKFGIGFLACYLLSNKVNVTSKRFNSKEINSIELLKGNEFVVTKSLTDYDFQGTDITLEYNEFFQVFKSVKEVTGFISKMFNTDIPIYIIDADTGTKNRVELLTSKLKDVKPRDEKSGLVNIDCSEFSDVLQGNIILKYDLKKADIITVGKGNKIYVYNALNKKFESKELSECDGLYTFICFPTCETENVEEKVRPEHRKRTLSILSCVGKYADEFITVMVPKGCRLKLYSSDDAVYVGDSDINEIFANSGVDTVVSFNDAGVRRRRGVHDVYISNGRMFIVRQTRVNDYFTYSEDTDDIEEEIASIYNESADRPKTRLYYNSIFVNKETLHVVKTPFKFKVYSLWCDIKNDANIALDVSRQKFIEGEDIYVNEINKAIYGYYLKYISGEQIIKDFFEKYILNAAVGYSG